MTLKTYDVKILLDSYCPDSGKRIVTWLQTHPSFCHQDFMTHRAFSRNASSLRAIPTKKILQQVWANPAIPIYWGRNQAGMAARQELTGWRRWAVEKLWLWARIPALAVAWMLWKVGLHKQTASRILSPWVWMTCVVTATEIDNYLRLRDHADAQPEMGRVAKLLRLALAESIPQILRPGEWHIPFAEDLQGFTLAEKKGISSGRCARSSYENHFGVRNTKDDIRLAQRLLDEVHMSPMEHQAVALKEATPCANLVGFRSYRTELEAIQRSKSEAW